MIAWLLLAAYFQFGVIPDDAFYAYEPPAKVYRGLGFYEDIGIEATAFKVFTIGGSARIYEWIDVFTPGVVPSFMPNMLHSSVYLEIAIGPLTVGAKEQCAHPIMPIQSELMTKAAWDSSRFEAYFRVDIGSRQR